jgi:hypothetical protein
MIVENIKIAHEGAPSHFYLYCKVVLNLLDGTELTRKFLSTVFLNKISDI